jgi:hypothetical protein
VVRQVTLVDLPNDGCTLDETAVVCNIVYTAEVNITTAASVTQKAVHNDTAAICRVNQIYIPIC